MEAALKAQAQSETENVTLKRTVTELKAALQEAEAKSAATSSNTVELEQLRVKVSSLERDKVRLEEDRRRLEAQVKEVKQQKSTTSNAPSSILDMTKLIEEKEFAESQVNFLNSIIADQQRSLEELKTTVKELETNSRAGIIGGVSSEGKVVAGSRVITPRLFCDICDIFDAHDTEECPRQAGGDDSPPLEQSHVLPRGHERPYCNTCESE
ncbi:hypothetical protein WDU94_006450 [Cyamophila willieti]